MKRKTGSIRKILCVCAAVFLIAALSSAAFAMTIEEQMAANSAAWWIAHNAGDQATCDALHAANVALAEQLASGGGNATYQYGSWEIDTSSGDHISSAEGSRDGINDIVNYATTGSDGSISTVTDWSYTDSSIGSYYDYGGTDEGLVTSYNNIGEYVSTSNEYGSESAKLSGASEVAVVKALLGLTDAQAAQLQADLEASKQAFESAHAAYIAAKAAGDTEAMEAARAQMDAAHDAAQETRRQYNYTGDSTDYSDGGYYHGWGGGPEGEVPDDVPFFVIDVKPTHKITAIATGGGKITPSGTVSVKQGDSQTFVLTPDPDAMLTRLVVDGREVALSLSYTFSNVTAAHSIQAEFYKSAYRITASCNDGGTISPAGTKVIARGSSQTYQITASRGYVLRDVLVDGRSVGARTSYPFINIRDDHSIEAVFARENCTIHAGAGNGGSVSPSGEVNVRAGSDAVFTITPDAGYAVASVLVDGTNVGAVTGYTFRNVQEDHSISALFSRLSFSVTASAGQGGSISPSGTTSVTYGGSVTYAVTPSAGYEIANVVVDGRGVGSVGSYTFSNVRESHTISASFRAVSSVDVGTPLVSDAAGVSLSGRSVKSGYGIQVSAPVTAQGVTDVRVVLSYDFGGGRQTVVMQKSGSSYVLPVNGASPTGSRVIYIPVATADATYTLTVTLSAVNAAGETVTDAATSTVTVLGSMYEDDFTGDS